MKKENRQETTNNDRKYPIVSVAAYIFNDRDELILLKLKNWNNKYSIIGGKIEQNETIEDALKREIYEETNLTLSDYKFYKIIDGRDVRRDNTHKYNHFIFINYIAKVKSFKRAKFNNQEIAGYKSQPLDSWMKEDKNKFAPYIWQELCNLKKYLEDKEGSFENKYKRALADYQNLLKRTDTEKSEFVKYANEQFILDILPIYDNLKISMSHLDEAARSNGWAEGIKYVIKQFKDILTNLGVEEVETKGKKFDPCLMEAVEGKGEKVKKEIKAGYKLNGKVIVPAKVILK